MAPPTLAIAALSVFQIGVLLVNRERIIKWAQSPRGSRIVGYASGNSMRIFLWHAPGFALAYGLWRFAGLPGQSPEVDAAWWAWRPLWLILPVIPTAILASSIGVLTVRNLRRATGARLAR